MAWFALLNTTKYSPHKQPKLGDHRGLVSVVDAIFGRVVRVVPLRGEETGCSERGEDRAKVHDATLQLKRQGAFGHLVLFYKDYTEDVCKAAALGVRHVRRILFYERRVVAVK